MSKPIKDELDRWQKTTLGKTLSKNPERASSFKTTSDIEIKRLYTPLDTAGEDYRKDLGFPGEYPFTRGVQSTMYRGRFWTMRQYAGFATAEETNRRFRYLLEQGQTGLSVAFDLPTQMGYDSDDPIAEGEVGRVGVAIDSLAAMERLPARPLPPDRHRHHRLLHRTGPRLEPDLDLGLSHPGGRLDRGPGGGLHP